jgi:hypothetical protein
MDKKDYMVLLEEESKILSKEIYEYIDINSNGLDISVILDGSYSIYNLEKIISKMKELELIAIRNKI